MKMGIGDFEDFCVRLEHVAEIGRVGRCVYLDMVGGDRQAIDFGTDEKAKSAFRMLREAMIDVGSCWWNEPAGDVVGRRVTADRPETDVPRMPMRSSTS